MEIIGKLGLKDESSEESLKAFFKEESKKFCPDIQTTKIERQTERYKQIKESLDSTLVYEKCLEDINLNADESAKMKPEFVQFAESAKRIGARLAAFYSPQNASKKVKFDAFLDFFESVLFLAVENRKIFIRWLSVKVQSLLSLLAAISTNKDNCLADKSTTILFVKEIKSALSFSYQDIHLFETADVPNVRLSFKNILELTPKCIQLVSTSGVQGNPHPEIIELNNKLDLVLKICQKNLEVCKCVTIESQEIETGFERIMDTLKTSISSYNIQHFIFYSRLSIKTFLEYRHFIQDQGVYNTLQNDLKIVIATARDGISKKVPDPLQAAGPLFAKFNEDYRRTVPFSLRLRLGALPLNLRKTPPEAANDNIESDDLNSFKALLGEAKDVNLQISKLLIRFF